MFTPPEKSAALFLRRRSARKMFLRPKRQAAKYSKRLRKEPPLKSEFENILVSNMLDEDQRSVLENLFGESALAEEAAIVLSAYYARIYPRQQYEQWIKALPDVFSASFLERLTKIWDKISEELLKSLRKYPPDLSQGLLSELYKNYNCEGNDAFSPKETMTLARACAALKRWENIDHIIRMLKMYELRDAISDLYSSKFNDANERVGRQDI